MLEPYGVYIEIKCNRAVIIIFAVVTVECGRVKNRIQYYVCIEYPDPG